jgi:hypothetical protein
MATPGGEARNASVNGHFQFKSETPLVTRKAAPLLAFRLIPL